MTTDQKIFLTLCGAGAAVLLLCKKRDGALGALGALPDGQKILRTQKQIAEIWDAGENGDASDDIIFRDGVAVFSGRLTAAAKDAGLELPVESSKKKDIRVAFRVLKSLDGGGLWRHNGQGTERKKEKKKKQSNKYTPWPQENGENIIHIHASYKGTNGDTKWRVGKSGLPNWNNFTMMVRRTLLNNGVSYDDLDAAGVTNDDFIDMEEFRGNGGDAYIVDADGKHFLPNISEDEEMFFERFKKRRAQEKQEKAAEQERERKLSQSSGKQGYAEKLDYARTIGLKGAASTKTEKALNKVIMGAGYAPETFVADVRNNDKLYAWYRYRKNKWENFDHAIMSRDTKDDVDPENYIKDWYAGKNTHLNLIVDDTHNRGGKIHEFLVEFDRHHGVDVRGVPTLQTTWEKFISFPNFMVLGDGEKDRMDKLRKEYFEHAEGYRHAIDLGRLSREGVYIYYKDRAGNLYLPRPSVRDKIYQNEMDKEEFEQNWKNYLKAKKK